MRYGNQIAETSVISPVRRLRNLEDVFGLIQAFSDNYGERFGEGSQAPEAGIRITVIRVIAYVELGSIRFEKLFAETGHSVQPLRMQICHFVYLDEAVETPVYSLDQLHPGTVLMGPALVESPRTTYLVEPGWRLVIGAQGSALMTRED